MGAAAPLPFMEVVMAERTLAAILREMQLVKSSGLSPDSRDAVISDLRLEADALIAAKRAQLHLPGVPPALPGAKKISSS